MVSNNQDLSVRVPRQLLMTRSRDIDISSLATEICTDVNSNSNASDLASASNVITSALATATASSGSSGSTGTRTSGSSGATSTSSGSLAARTDSPLANMGMMGAAAALAALAF